MNNKLYIPKKLKVGFVQQDFMVQEKQKKNK